MTSVPNVRLTTVFVDRVARFAREVDELSGRTFVSFPVHNRMATYSEHYEVDRETFERYQADPTLAHELVARAKAREVDHLLLFQPGSDRGSPD